MARNTTFIAAAPEQVFAVLADPDAYGVWVVGSQAIRGADRDFPAPGTRFLHRVGVGPLTIPDETRVLESDPPRRLVLHAKARPLGTAKVTIELEARDGGTLVTLVEDPGDRLTALAFTPVTHLLVRLRNAESLRRLRALAEA